MAKQGRGKPPKAMQIREAFRPVASLPPVNGDLFRFADVLDERGRATVERVRRFVESEIAPFIGMAITGLSAFV
jgi:hypothetical protein